MKGRSPNDGGTSELKLLTIYLKPFLTSGILKNAINSLKIFVLLMNCYPYHKDLRLQVLRKKNLS